MSGPARLTESGARRMYISYFAQSQFRAGSLELDASQVSKTIGESLLFCEE
jgi:hypothetical protein